MACCVIGKASTMCKSYWFYKNSSSGGTPLLCHYHAHHNLLTLDNISYITVKLYFNSFIKNTLQDCIDIRFTNLIPLQPYYYICESYCIKAVRGGRIADVSNYNTQDWHRPTGIKIKTCVFMAITDYPLIMQLLLSHWRHVNLVTR